MRLVTVNLLWVILFLTSIIIAQFVITPSGELLRELISFAAAVASLLLALVAIGYSFISSNSLQTMLAEVRSSAGEIAKETARINEASRGLSDEVEEALRVLPKRIDDLPAKLEHQFKARELDAASTVAAPPKELSADGAEEHAGRTNGMLFAIYALCMSHKHSKPLEFDKVFKGLPDSFSYYCTGVFETFRTYRVCDVVVEGFEGKYYASSVGSLRSDVVIRETEGYIRKLPDDHALPKGMVGLRNFLGLDQVLDSADEPSDKSEDSDPGPPSSDVPNA